MRFDFWNKDAKTRQAWLICLLLALATVGVYWRVGTFEFTQYDEYFLIVSNPIVRAGLTLDGIRWALTTSWFEYWHPVTWMSFMLDCQIFGMRPGLHHLMNLAFHTADSLLVFIVLQRFTGSRWRSAIVAGLFALHPLHVESVAWAAERKDVLSALFFLLTLWGYARYVQAAKAGEPNERFWYIGSLVLFALGLMSKPMLITLPFVLLLLDYWPLRRLEFNNLLDRLREKVPFFALTVASSAISYMGVKAGGNILSAETVPWLVRLANVPVSYSRYLIKTIWPTNLAILYPMPGHLGFWQVAAAVALVGGISLWVILRARSEPYLVFGWFTFLGVLFPTIGLVQAGLQAIADRYTYIPSIGLFIAIVWSLTHWSERIHLPRVVPITAATLVLGVCSLMTWNQVGYWRNGLTLWSHCVEVTSESNITAVFNRGYALQLAGRDDQALEEYKKVLKSEPDQPHANRNDYLYANLNLGAILVQRRQMAQATNYFNRALQIAPQEPKAHANLGLALRELGDLDGAMAHCAEAIQLDPGQFGPFFDMAMALSAVGRSREAVDYFSEALKRNPAAPQLHYYLGIELLRLGQIESANASLREAVRLQPGWPDARFQLGVCLAAQGSIPEAVVEYREALRLEPGLTTALNNLAWILATSPDAKLRDGVQAVRLAEQACEQTSWKQTIFVGTLAAAYAEAGQFEKAVETSRKACDLANSLGQTNLLVLNQECSRKFQNHVPYRHAD